MIAITMGDANGIGPELVLKAWLQQELRSDFIVVGDAAVLEHCARYLSLQASIRAVKSASESERGRLNVIDLGMMTGENLRIGQLAEDAGRAAIAYVRTATRLAIEGRIQAVVTLPVNKEAVRLSEPDFSGHTELIAEMCGISRYTMMLASEKLIVTHVSTHVSLEEAIRAVRRERIADVIALTHEAVSRFHPHPRIAVAGLNPHASEHGAFGAQEAEEIAPAIADARSAGIDAIGPEAPDTVFLRAVHGSFDAVVCMYHDQGHIPMKLLDFDAGVNITLGLPIIRTSVDHGTAYDIAYQGTATTKSLVAAFDFARKLTGDRSR
ncbi:MAG TPA: 4-hydroxythreonine-4-phosphate dehydrogenase PdxA [Spirochaetia bacterium]|nr:4-hydroxythreonine-4-phosphate dehydrogenase PdxA [Spirochaetia bacterium]